MACWTCPTGSPSATLFWLGGVVWAGFFALAEEVDVPLGDVVGVALVQSVAVPVAFGFALGELAAVALPVGVALTVAVALEVGVEVSVGVLAGLVLPAGVAAGLVVVGLAAGLVVVVVGDGVIFGVVLGDA